MVVILEKLMILKYASENTLEEMMSTMKLYSESEAVNLFKRPEIKQTYQ